MNALFTITIAGTTDFHFPISPVLGYAGNEVTGIIPA